MLAALTQGPDADQYSRADPLALLLHKQRTAFWRDGIPDLSTRLDRLRRLRALIIDNEELLGEAISADFGFRSRAEARLIEFAPVALAIKSAIRMTPKWTKPVRVGVHLETRPAHASIHYQPLGVVGIIAPWNYPLSLAAIPLANALAAGNRIMLKPSEFTPAFSEAFATLINESFDEEEVAVVTGGVEIAELFAALPFDHLLYTGSTAVGRKVALAAARNLTPVTLELGGKSPMIVCDDYPFERAAKDIAPTKLMNAGQTCVAPDYVLAPRDKVEALGQAIIAEAEKLYPTLDDNRHFASIINERQHGRLISMLDEARECGVSILQHSGTEPIDSRKMRPAVVLNPPEDLRIMQEEIFGPVLPIIGYDRLEDATAFVRRREHPLALYCLSHSRASRNFVLAQTLSGGVTLNGAVLHIVEQNLPFGGVGASGMGAYHGFEGFKRFSHARSVLELRHTNPFDILRAPYGRAAELFWAFAKR